MEVLEQKGQGLNLTWEVRNGILNHRTSGHPATLEGNVVRLSDKIAYINHDIDDAIRGKIMKEEDLPREYTDILGNSVHERLNIMIHDIIEHSQDKPEVAMSPEREEAMHGCAAGCLTMSTMTDCESGGRARTADDRDAVWILYGASGGTSGRIPPDYGDEK